MEKGFDREADMVTVNFEKEVTQSFSFKVSAEKNCDRPTSPVLKYLYEPNAAILKSGAFKLVGKNFALNKVSQHTHLYTSEEIVKEFPGKIFEVIDSYAPNKKQIKSRLSKQKISIKSRNYPESVAQIRKKYKIMLEGEDIAVFFCKVEEQYQVIETKRVYFDTY